MRGEQILDGLIELSHTAPELCPSCKFFEDAPIEKPEWGRWCNRLTTNVTRVWLCTVYEQIDESEEQS
jgi:hypothetical protein